MEKNKIYSALTTIDSFVSHYSMPAEKQQQSLLNNTVSIIYDIIKDDNKLTSKYSNLKSLSEKNDYDNILQSLKNLKSDLVESVSELRENSNQRMFTMMGSNSFGSDYQRNQLVDAIADKCNTLIDTSSKVSFPNNFLSNTTEKVLHDILSENANYIQQHKGISDNIQADTLKWIEEIDKILQQENPFRDEIEYIDGLKQLESEKLVTQFKSIHQWYDSKNISPNLNFDFYEQSHDKNLQNIDIEEKKQYNEALSQKFFEEVDKSLLERILAWQLNKIDEYSREYIDQTSEKIKKFKHLEHLLMPFLEDSGLLWNMSDGMFQNAGFEIIKKYADLLEQDQSLIDFANILGKHSRAQIEYEKEIRAKVVVTNGFHPQPAQKGQIAGITVGNDISAVLPSELALLKNLATARLFKLKFAQKQLVSFRYENMQSVSETKTEYVEISHEKIEPKGPIIICVDTSGSMEGTPEYVAKTLTFAICKIAMEQHRKCYLISFSKKIETLDLSNFNSSNNSSLQLLIGFLRMSFHGGTDIAPALNHAIEMLSQNEWKSADVLTISDFCMDNLRKNITDRINLEKRKDTDFHSLVIGDSENGQVIDCFSHNWYYDMTNSNSPRRIIEKIRKIKNKDNKLK